MLLAAFDGTFPKIPYRRKNFTKISYASRVIANFVPKFVDLATGVGRGENAIGSIRWSVPEKLSICAKNLAEIFYASRAIANLVPNFVAMATEVNRGQI